ncbi:MAG TPA: PilZ domain-containing protein [Candidatus Methylomirabilis sp.]|nr:PilZ domain-containing protein [Candidatus Methylomirabilis sp.]
MSSDDKNKDERRQHQRRVISLEGELLEPSIGVVKIYTIDLSEGGAFVALAADKCPPVGTTITLRLPGVLWGEQMSTVSGRVVRVTDQGMAVQFFDFDVG